MLEILYTIGGVWWVGYAGLAIITPIVGLFVAACIKAIDGSFSQGEARGILAMLSAPVTALIWPLLLMLGIYLAFQGLLSDAGIESLAERRARRRMETQARAEALAIAKSKAVQQRDREIKRLEALLRPDQPWNPPDWENDPSVDPARRTA